VSWSYSGDPSSSDRDAVRFAIGDTDTNDQQLTDEEIDYLLGLYPTVNECAIACVDSLIAKYARLVSQSVGAISISYGERLSNYKTLLGRLSRKRGRLIPFAGGTTISGKDTADEDTDRDPPKFKVGMFDRTS